MQQFIHPITRKPIKLGRRHRSARTRKSIFKGLAMAKFLSELPAAPASCDNTFDITSWGVMLNDQLGDCTIAACGHLIQVWTASQDSEKTVPDSAILSDYEAWCGYVNGDPSTDDGGIISVVIEDWQNQGLAGYDIMEHAPVTLSIERIQQAIYLLGALDGGVELPVTAQNQVGGVWEVVGHGQTGDSTPGSWGGHSTAIVAYNAAGLTCVTWGALQRMTWNFFMTYYDEAWGIISPNWKSPFPTSVLENDLLQLSGSEGTGIPVSLSPFVVNP